MNILKKFRFYSRLILAFVRKQQKIILLGIVVGVLMFWLSPKLSFLLPSKNLKKIGIVGRFTPTELPLEVQNLISAGLTQISADGSVSPSLASSWEANEEGKKYKFVLKENLFWQDNTPIKSADINYNFSDVVTKVVDEKTLQFELKESFSPFPTIVSQPVFKKGLIGVGEYKVKSLTRRGQIVEKIVLVSVKNPSYPTLVFRFYPTEEAVRTAFKLGEVDLIKEISHPANLEQWPGIKITSQVKNSRYVAIFFNTQNEYLADKSLRQAFVYAIKKRWEPRAFNPFNPDSWAYNPGVKPYNFDLENGKKLLEKSQEEREEESRIKEIELSTVPSLLSIAEDIANDWQGLGIETKVKVINVIPQDFQALLVTQEIPPDPDQYTLWHSTQVTNLSRYKNPKIDKLLEDGRKIQDKEKRKEIYFDFQRFIVEDTPVIFLFHPTLYTISRE